jgi:hypothetical protein
MMAVKPYSIERLSGIPEGDVYLLPVSQYPLSKSELNRVRRFVNLLVEEFQLVHGTLSLEVFVRQRWLYTGLLDIFVDNARQWRPQQGLAVIPHKPPPHIPSKNVIEGIDPRLIKQSGIHGVIDIPECVFQIMNVAYKEECCMTMAGHGALSIILTKLTSKELKQAWKELFGKRVTDRAFRNMRSYIPLFGAQSFQSATDDALASWFRSFELYIGESIEDRGIVIASGRNIESLIEKLRNELPGPIIEPEVEILRW